MPSTGRVKKDASTKRLIPRLCAGDIALIDHEDLDEVAAGELTKCRPGAVLNLKPCLTERYPHSGPAALLKAGIPVIDLLDAGLSELLTEGEIVTVKGTAIIRNGKVLAQGRRLTEAALQAARARGRSNLTAELEGFLENTLEYAWKERELILGGFSIPAQIPSFHKRQALVVVRGQSYRDDLEMIRPYVLEVRPVLVGVDGGADALLECGFRPDFIVGDMDSVSDQALTCGGQIVLHAYPDGRAPGQQRLESLGVDYLTVAATGTSEDVALMMCYEREAELIVAVGTHSNIVDFLDKGRAGMASTFLVRLKVGSSLVDARGISRLYRGRLKTSHLLAMFGAALVPAGVVGLLGAPSRNLLRLLILRFLVWLGY